MMKRVQLTQNAHHERFIASMRLKNLSRNRCSDEKARTVTTPERSSLKESNTGERELASMRRRERLALR